MFSTDIPDNSIYQLGIGVFLLVVGFAGQWFFERIKPKPSVAPELAAVLVRRNKLYRDACLMAMGFALFAILHFLHAALRARQISY